jgi:hypothetical protein
MLTAVASRVGSSFSEFQLTMELKNLNPVYIDAMRTEFPKRNALNCINFMIHIQTNSEVEPEQNRTTGLNVRKTRWNLNYIRFSRTRASNSTQFVKATQRHAKVDIILPRINARLSLTIASCINIVFANSTNLIVKYQIFFENFEPNMTWQLLVKTIWSDSIHYTHTQIYRQNPKTPTV